MNKQEVLKKLERKKETILRSQKNLLMESELWGLYEARATTFMSAINIVEQLDEPKKVKVPAFVVEYINWCKQHDWQLTAIATTSNADYFESHSEPSGLHEWIIENYATFLIAIATGEYEVEEEPKWVVKIEDNGSAYFVDFFDELQPHLVYGLSGEVMRFDSEDKANAIVTLIECGTVEKV
ncbi:MAG: DUF1642 domain-containing protein [Enterococcus avium]